MQGSGCVRLFVIGREQVGVPIATLPLQEDARASLKEVVVVEAERDGDRCSARVGLWEGGRAAILCKVSRTIKNPKRVFVCRVCLYTHDKTAYKEQLEKLRSKNVRSS